MPMQTIILSCLVLVILSSCSPGHKIDQGRTSTGEAYKTVDAEVQANASPEPVVQAAVTENASPTPQLDADDDDNNQTALEPVAIGGAFLTCRYQNGQMQGSEAYRMECDVAPLTEVKVPIASALFYKLDAQGNRSPLTVVSQDLSNLKWTVEEGLSTMSQVQVQVVLSATGYPPKALTTTVSPTLNLVQNPVFFLGGEPNSLTPDEDCVEFVPANGKISHQNFTGLVSGPLGRMNDNNCTLSYNFLCRNNSAGAGAPKWALSANAGPFANGALACSPGYAFGYPLNAAEVREVISLVDRLDIKIWVNMNDIVNENTFLIKFR